jgi:hypothetical protein
MERKHVGLKKKYRDRLRMLRNGSTKLLTWRLD